MNQLVAKISRSRKQLFNNFIVFIILAICQHFIADPVVNKALYYTLSICLGWSLGIMHTTYRNAKELRKLQELDKEP